MGIKNIFTILIFFFQFLAFSQQKENIEKLEFVFIKDSIFSKFLNEFRTIKIYLPKEYKIEEKYPVLYTLDAESIFEPTVSEVKFLTDFGVIPKSIVIGIYHKNRNADLSLNWQNGNHTEISLMFQKFLFEELIPSMNLKYSISGFNCLVGHSNSATYIQKILIQENQPFRGFVCLSQNLFGSQLEEFQNFLRVTLKNEIFYFVASGKRDATDRLESGLNLESIFLINQNKKVVAKHIIYDADHNGVAAKGLNNGISHIFSLYKHFNDWDENLIDSLLKNNVKSFEFITNYSKMIEEVYGVKFKVDQNDLSFMQSLTKTDDDVKKVQEFEIEKFGKNENFYANYAQIYEYIKSYNKALEYWIENLNRNYSHNENFFYYLRPIELLDNKMNEHKRAIDFAIKEIENSPNNELYFDYLIAKIASENNLERKVGLRHIQNCISKYKENKIFELEEAKQIEIKLKK